MKFFPDLSENSKNVSGMINIPKGEGNFPVIVMFRGFVSQEIYETGIGTRPSAKVFAENGFITVAPDFLGYADSDMEAGNIFESRFQTYVTAAVTLKSISSIEKWDGKNIFLWGHSNGGQVALTTLEITGVSYPTILWAPVGRPFPASILYYIDEAADGGKFLIDQLAGFEDTYDAEKYSLTNYLDKIKAPIEINQGTADTAVPYWWSDDLNERLTEEGVDVTYKKHPGADHNLIPAWNNAIENSINFYSSHLEK
jgi:dipeptidyl aminopeptidase/acylaminoacyl peptidase